MNYCTRCGTQIPPGSTVCPNCGAGQRRGGGINNIFTALTRERTPGAIMEFTLWCIVCFVALMALIAAIVGNGNITWIMLMLFSAGLAVLMAFRLKPIAMLYSIGVFYFLLPIIHFVSFSRSNRVWDYYTKLGHSPLNIVLFVLTLVLSIGLLACGFVFNFTRVNLGNLLTILVLVESGLLMLLEILMYAAPYIGTGLSAASLIDYNDYLREYLNYRGYWVGTVSMWCIFIVIMLLYIFFFWGFIEKRPERILYMGRGGAAYPGGGAVSSAGGAAYLRGISGAYAGRDISLNGGVLTIGSGEEVQLRINDASVSRKHCAVRFNTATGFYEVQDISTNGVFLNTGSRLPKGNFTSVNRGSVICIGSQAQQFRLM